MLDKTCLGFKNYSTAMVVLLVENEIDVATLVHTDLQGFKSNTQAFMTPIINLKQDFFWESEFDINEVNWDEVRNQILAE